MPSLLAHPKTAPGPEAAPLGTRPAGCSGPWIHSPGLDWGGILLPPIGVSLAVLIWPGLFQQPGAHVSPAVWLLVVLGVDVAHVYATLYRTYLDPQAWARLGWAFLAIPLSAWIVGVGVYQAFGALGFWRVLAYLAVFHFVRQQYGLMAWYGRHDPTPWPRWRWLDAAAIYGVTLYPLAYWHTHLPRAFDWFLAGDFWPGLPPVVTPATGIAALLCLVGYGGKEIALGFRHRWTNAPKHWVLLGTLLAWNVGIVWTNTDLAFTLTNVLSHGIPYLALVWAAGHRAAQRQPSRPMDWGLRAAQVFRPAALPLWLGFLILLAYLEEGLWDCWVWREQVQWFSAFHRMFNGAGPGGALTLVVPLLAVPQITHYLLDGLIWRLPPVASSASGSEPQNIPAV